MRSDPLQAIAAGGAHGWLVGGALRDRLLGRETTDFDVVTTGDPRQVARAAGRRLGAHAFRLSDGFGAWRVVARDHSWQLDLLPLTVATIEDDLAQRDLTINALAEPLGGGALVDPFGGLADLRERRLRMVSASAFEADPLRTLRLARLACELDFSAEPDTASVAAGAAGGLADVAPERTFTELKLIVTCDRALDGLALMDRLGLTQVILPELVELRGIEQSQYHHLDVHDHTRAVLAEVIALERDPSGALGEQAAAVSELLGRPLANDLTRWQALRFGALLHDIAKPQTRRVTEQGRVTFIGHDETGAEMANAVLRRLRASARLSEYVAALTRHHLRLGFLVHQMPLSRRASYRYLKAVSPVQVDVTVLSVADRLATRGKGSGGAIAKHLELARQVLAEAFAWLQAPPRPPLRGDELARALGVRPGPDVGRLLAELEEASYAGEIEDREQAIALGRELLRGRSAGAAR